MKLSLGGMKGLGVIGGVSSVSNMFSTPKGTTEGAAASRTGVSVVLLCSSVGPRSKSESVQLKTEP